MKKTKMINSELSYVISQMGHTNSLTIGDCGLPIPNRLRTGIEKWLDTMTSELEGKKGE